jgi:hypothetical protein
MVTDIYISKEDIKDLINSTLEDFVNELYKKYDVKHGDIEPLQSIRWDNIVSDMAELFKELIQQNS